MQKKLNILSCYCRKNQFEVNINKAKILRFSKGRPKKEKLFMNNNKSIDIVTEIVCFGVRIRKSDVFLKEERKARIGSI